jgi:hypothetical protein
VNALLVVGVFVFIYGLASIGIAMAFRDGSTRMVLNILVWTVLMAAAVAIRLSGS